jgi:homoserine dehydrogenase
MPESRERSRSPVPKATIHIGLLGLGTVGAGTAETLVKQRRVMLERTGIDLVLKKAADLDIKREWGFDMPASVPTTDAKEVLEDPEIKIVIELIGGTGIAKKFIETALSNGKAVVTANKALLAKHGHELFELAAKNHVDLFYEASVAGGIPIIKALREGLVANPIKSIHGILNGTCNYILTRMEREGVAFDTVLKDAQNLGFAEAEPSLDIDGWDTAHKAIILSQLAFGGKYDVEQIHVKGIRGLSGADVQFASEFGYRIKLLAILKKPSDAGVEISIEPALIPSDHLFSKVDMSFNAVFVSGEVVDETMYYGRGAGRLPTASAVVADVCDVARNIDLQPQCRKHRQDRNPLRHMGSSANSALKPHTEYTTRAYLRLELKDVPGALGEILGKLADHNISILALTDFLRGRPLPGAATMPKNGYAPVVILTGDVKVGDLDKAIEEMKKLSVVGPDIVRFRVEDMRSS